jgi:CubicO group peptidase (beta-lactamase class C family)
MCFMRRISLLVFVSVVGFGQPMTRQMQVDKIFSAFNKQTPGCAVGVSQAGRVVLTGGYGMADLERGVAIGPGTIFESGSVAKQFTAATLILLAQQGKISLDDKMGKYLPELSGAPASVTIRQVMSHTSGMREWRPVATFSGRDENETVLSNRDLLGFAARQKALNFDPGSAYSYSNTGYNIATILVERALGNGKSFQAYTQEQIFGPLGMTNTEWRDNFRSIVPGRALAYTKRADGVVEQATPIGNIIGAGGLLTTVADLLKWNENFVEHKVGGKEMVELQQKPAVLTNGKTIAYAAGLQVTTVDGLREVAHSGATGGYRTWLGRYPDQGLSVAVLCNSAQAVPTNLGRDTARLWTGAVKLNAVQTSSMNVTGMAGLYRKLRDNSAVEVKEKDGRLVLPGGAVLTPGEGGRLLIPGENGDTVYQKVEQARPMARELASFAGEYSTPEAGSKLVVAVNARGLLTLRIGGGEAMVLTPTFQDAFRSGEGSILFRRDAAGKVVGLSVGDDRVWDLRFERVK